MARTKQIFISDLHMGTAESVEGKSPYGWLLTDRARLLAEFLSKLARDETLAELVVVGDLFDEWVVPYPVPPVPPIGSPYADQFAKIAIAGQNQPVIQALQDLANSGVVTVTYVPGNHDMLIEREAITRLIGDKVKTVITGPGKGIYTSGKVAAEHGSLYCMFNAPDTYDNPGHSLPLGFFVARSQAEGTTTGHPVTKKQYTDILFDALSRMVHHEQIAQAVFDSVVDEIKAPGNSMEMDGINRYSGKIATSDVSETFKYLFKEWDESMPDNVPATIAAIGEGAMLFPAALLQYLVKKKPQNIVVFGHTHEWEVRGFSLSLKSIEELLEDFTLIRSDIENGDYKAALKIIEDLADPGPDAESDFIYVNSGTWIDGDSGVAGDQKPPATYVVIDEAGGKTTAEVYQYTGGELFGPNSLLGSRFTTK